MNYLQPLALNAEQESAYGRRFGAVLRKRREEKGLSQEDVALLVGMDRRHYQELEHGFSNSRTRSPANPRMFTLINLARALEIDVEEFFR
ncbi:MAG: helix-turn-helix transcriptional regulator [Actinomycetaceae bacterium]|nr:helix-turn-helix transcriptional regulator [Actinomycetaceae bacterium]